MNAREIMKSDQIWACAEKDDARAVARMMHEHDVGSIPVLDQKGRLEGIITDRDICLRVVAQGRSFETPARAIMTTEVHCVGADTDLNEIEQAMRQYKIRRLPVVDDERKLLGFISFSDLVHHCQGSSAEHELVEVFDEVTSSG